MKTQLNQPLLCTRDLRVSLEDKEIVLGVDIDIRPGEIHALMGPNGSGKSTLAAALMGHPDYLVSGGLEFKGRPLAELPPEERAARGMFLGFQYPTAVPGLTLGNFLRAVLENQRGTKVPIRAFRQELDQALGKMQLPSDFVSRYLNVGFSGGEKKRVEIVQMLLTKPAFALLDEIDSGLDIDALKLVAKGIEEVASQGTAVLLITHYQRLLDYLPPHRVHVFIDGRIQRSGDSTLAHELESQGYDWLAPKSLAAAGGAA